MAECGNWQIKQQCSLSAGDHRGTTMDLQLIRCSTFNQARQGWSTFSVSSLSLLSFWQKVWQVYIISLLALFGIYFLLEICSSFSLLCSKTGSIQLPTKHFFRDQRQTACPQMSLVSPCACVLKDHCGHLTLVLFIALCCGLVGCSSTEYSMRTCGCGLHDCRI